MRKLGYGLLVVAVLSIPTAVVASPIRGSGIFPAGITLCCDQGLYDIGHGGLAGNVLFQPGQQMSRPTIDRASYTDPSGGTDRDIVFVSVVGRSTQIFATASMNTSNRQGHPTGVLTIRLNRPAPRYLVVAYLDIGLWGD